MKKLGLLAILLVAGCTQTTSGMTYVPKRFARDAGTPEHCAYYVESTTSEGFVLEVLFSQYSWDPSPDEELVKGRSCFADVARNLARGKGRGVAPITSADVDTMFSRNEVDAHNSVYVTGRVRYARE